MKFAACLGSYALPHFVDLNIRWLKAVFGNIPILVSDDKSYESAKIKAVTAAHGCSYYQSRERRGHFGGDVQAIVNAITFGQQTGADISIKISQRFLILSPDIKSKAEQIFAGEKIFCALPGRVPPAQIKGHKGFAHYPYLTDVMFFAPQRIEASFIKNFYDTCWKTATKWHELLVEISVAKLMQEQWKDKHTLFNEITAHEAGKPFRFLRRYMNTPDDYKRVAERVGLTGHFSTSEWRKLEPKYLVRPMA